MIGNIYEMKRSGIISFLMVSVLVIAIFLYYSNSLVKNLSEQERSRMQIWADATKEIVRTSDSDVADHSSSIDFLLSIIEDNDNIPVLLTDAEGNIIMHRNFNLPEKIDDASPLFISDANRDYLVRKYEKLKGSSNVIVIDVGDSGKQYLYYEDSDLLRSLSLYPYVQLMVLLIFVGMVYYAVSSTKKAEQNKVWVGLSKETAHQLGTPISSLAAWMELLGDMDVDKNVLEEMSKDVNRLSTIASRFSKIGSTPSMNHENVDSVVIKASEYMSTRISKQIKFNILPSEDELISNMSAPLFEWVMENIIKNAIDAMDGKGSLTISVYKERNYAVIDVTDTGKGIAKKNQKAVFRPGYTTKNRGWGLGLTLAKRIVEEYHKGEIFVKRSEIGVGSTFTIMIPLVSDK